jgi:Asp-tRNA(Asn)/Glu-tRNA(Gln) amidotransferase A subunit family amidase
MNRLFLERAIPELRASLMDGSLSFRDLARATASRIEEAEGSTFAWICHDLARLVAHAECADATSRAGRRWRALDGVPFGVKDIFNTRDFPTEMGSPIWKGFTPGNNARVVDSLLNAGGAVVGKTVTAEFAVHTLNETLNPHDPSRSPGTSSSGSAAAVASGMVPFALGTQTAGSIVRPASFCGVWGMKPSFGMIPRTGVLKTTDSLDTIGFLAAHAQSLRPILDTVRVQGPNYPFVYRNVDLPGPRPKAVQENWRLGFVKTHTWRTATPYAQRAIEDLASRIGREQGFEIEELEWPGALEDTHDVHETIYAKSLSYYFQNEAKTLSHISPLMREMMDAGESISREKFLEAIQRQNLLCDELDRLLVRYDMVLSLATSSSAPLRGEMELPDPSLIWTMGHVPSVAAPVFRCPTGLPFGAQFVSRKWNDYLMLQGIEALVERGVLPLGSQDVVLNARACL